MAASTACILTAMWWARTKKTPRGIIYWLPTDGDVGDFVKTKVDTLIADNEELQTNVQLNKQAYNQGLKFIYNTPTYWRGLKSKVGVKAISADAAIYDEFDEADQSQVSQARKRISASDVKLERELSTPTLPDYGINKLFQETDQCHYSFQCSHCSRWCILEEYFPDCFQQDLNGNYFHACRYCKNALQIQQGRWIQKNQQSHIRGYQISQLFSPFVSPNEIMKEYQSTEFMGHFYNHVLGIPYLSASDRVTREMVLNLCDPLHLMNVMQKQPTAMGVDVGSVLHCTAIDPKTNKVVWVGEVKQFEELDALMLKLNCQNIVIDALPETRKVREFIARNKNRAWMCYYNDNQKGSYAWNEEERIVQVNRTESLDSGTQLIISKKISFPQRSKPIETLADHCQNIAKVCEEDKETGDKKYVYKKIGPDHYRHSLNYALIAASRMRHGSVISVFR